MLQTFLSKSALNVGVEGLAAFIQLPYVPYLFDTPQRDSRRGTRLHALGTAQMAWCVASLSGFQFQQDFDDACGV